MLCGPGVAGVTPLHIAAWLGHQATASALLAAGADPEVACLEVGAGHLFVVSVNGHVCMFL